MEIAKYTVGVDFNLKWKELDKNLKKSEKRLAALGKKLKLNLSDFVVDQKRLNLVLKDAFRNAEQTVPFKISRFIIDNSALNRAIGAASGTGRLGGYQQRGALSREEWDRREQEKQRLWWERRQALREDEARRVANRLQNGSTPGLTSRHAGIAGGIGGFTARAYMPLLGIAAGGYGLGALNRRNQEIVSAQLQTSAIVQQAGGNASQGTQAFEWLRSEGERVGFNWLEAIPDYNKLISGLTGAGMTVGQSQGVFQGFSELARVNKLDRTSQNRLFRALSQVAGKNQLMSEELTGQIAEALPGGVAIFAEAYQRQLAAQGKGGGKTGSEAIAELRAAMEKRQVKGDILLYAGNRASEMAQPGLTAAQKASQAEQARFQNAYNELARVASESGVESGFSRLFRAMADGAREAAPLVKSLAGGFDEVTKYVSSMLLTFQSIQRFFQGRDSFLGDKLFPDDETRNKAFLWLEQTKIAFSEVNTLIGNSFSAWKQLLGLLESNSVLDRLTQAMSTIANGAGALNALIEGDYGSASELASQAGKRVINTVTAPGRAGANTLLEGGTRLLEALDPRVSVGSTNAPRIPSFDVDKTTIDYQAEQTTQRRLAAAQARKDGYPQPTGIFPLGSGGSVTATFNIYDATNPEEVGQVVNRHLNDLFNSTKLEYSQKE